MIELRDPVAEWFIRRSLPTKAAVAATMWAMAIAEFQRSGPQFAIFFTLLFFVAAVVLSELLRPKPNIEDARPAGLGDFQVPTATEGRVVPLIWGRVRQRGPNVIWYGDLQQEAITERVKTGLWSSERITKGFKYHLGIQFAIARGSDSAPVTLKRVWIGDDEVFNGTVSTDTFFDIDEPELFGGDDLGSGGVQATCDFYTGTSSQLASPYLDVISRQRVGSAITPTAPRYVNTCYVVARELTGDDPLASNVGAYIGNSTSLRAWSFEVERFPALFSGQSAGENKIASVDANPINCIYELLTDREWGFGFPSTDIDVGPGSSFLDAADRMITEGNGLSMILDRQMRAKELLHEFERQIDGVVFLDHRTGKWRVKLARNDYSIGSVPQLDDSNVSEVLDYTRGSWEDTTNTIQVQYDKRDDDYKQSFALAQDTANAIMQGGGTIGTARSIVAKVVFPGVKSSALAANLAWRELRGQSYPLARCKLVVNRKMWGIRIGDVVAWTNTRLGYTQLPMRVTNVNYGQLDSNKMTLTVVQDVFKFAAASMGTPPATGWTPPSVSLVAFPSNEQLAVEAPLGILTRDPEFSGDYNISKVFCAAGRQGGEVAFDITQRNASGTPSGTYADAGTVVSFMRIGALASDLDSGSSVPVSTVTITPDASSQSQLEAVFDDSSTLSDLGVDLAQLIMVGNEFMLVRSAANSGPNVNLQNVYRGVLDTAQSNHLAGAKVYLVFVGAGLSDTTFPTTNNVDIELRMRSSSLRYSGSVTPFNLTMSKRAIRPYPPVGPHYNGSGSLFGTPAAEGAGSGENGVGINVGWRRRIMGPSDEVQALLADTDPDTHPDASGTEYQVRVFVDPNGSNTEIGGSPFSWTAGTGPVLVNRNSIQEVAPAGTEIRVQIQARHDIFTETNLTSRHTMIHDVTPTSANDGLFYLGGNLGASTPTNSYTAVATGTFTVRIGAAYSTSNVQYRLNGGTWTTVIAAGGTSGTIPGVVSSDTIELRHTVSQSPDPQFVAIENPSSARVAYGYFSA